MSQIIIKHPPVLPLARTFASRLRVMFFLILLATIGCSPGQDVRELPPVLRIGMLPTVVEGDVLRGHQLMIDYLSETLGVETEVILAESYQQLLERFGNGEIDLALFGGATFLQANDVFGAVPLVSRNTDSRYTSYIVINSGTPAKTLLDLKGVSFAFGDSQSTSGHLMPRLFLENEGIVPEDDFESIEYSGSHDLTLKLVADGSVTAGAVDSSVLDSMFQKGELDDSRIKVIWETPPFANYVWAIQPDFSREAVISMRDAFLSLARNNPRHAAVLDELGASYFVPAARESYSQVQTALDNFQHNQASE